MRVKHPTIIAICVAFFNASTYAIGGNAFLGKKSVVNPISLQQSPSPKVRRTDDDFHVRLRGGEKSTQVSGGTASIPNEIFNLVKSIVGAGVLSLSAGIASYGDAPSAVIPAIIMITVIGAISAYGFSLIGRVCADTGAKSYKEAWEKTVGESSSWITAASSAFSCLLANLAYSMILADTFKNLLAAVGITLSRTQTCLAVTGVVLLPLCLLKDLSSLAPFSLLGIMGMAYTTLAMTLRYFDGSYGPEGKFVSEIASAPLFGNKGAASVMSASSLILLGLLSTAYMAHFNAPKFYIELQNNTIERFNTVVTSSFALSIAIFCAVAAVGFLTFGAASDGLILNNYSNNDSIMSLSRVAVASSIVFSYPLVFVGTRDGLLDLMNVPMEKRSESLVNRVTLLTLGFITGSALVIKDLSFVMSFGGATLGNALIYVFPALMFKQMISSKGDQATPGQKAEVIFAMMSCLLGLFMGGMGAYMSVKSLHD